MPKNSKRERLHTSRSEYGLPYKKAPQETTDFEESQSAPDSYNDGPSSSVKVTPAVDDESPMTVAADLMTDRDLKPGDLKTPSPAKPSDKPYTSDDAVPISVSSHGDLDNPKPMSSEEYCIKSINEIKHLYKIRLYYDKLASIMENLKSGVEKSKKDTVKIGKSYIDTLAQFTTEPVTDSDRVLLRISKTKQRRYIEAVQAFMDDIKANPEIEVDELKDQLDIFFECQKYIENLTSQKIKNIMETLPVQFARLGDDRDRLKSENTFGLQSQDLDMLNFAISTDHYKLASEFLQLGCSLAYTTNSGYASHKNKLFTGKSVIDVIMKESSENQVQLFQLIQSQLTLMDTRQTEGLFSKIMRYTMLMPKVMTEGTMDRFFEHCPDMIYSCSQEEYEKVMCMIISFQNNTVLEKISHIFSTNEKGFRSHEADLICQKDDEPKAEMLDYSILNPRHDLMSMSHDKVSIKQGQCIKAKALLVSIENEDTLNDIKDGDQDKFIAVFEELYKSCKIYNLDLGDEEESLEYLIEKITLNEIEDRSTKSGSLSDQSLGELAMKHLKTQMASVAEAEKNCRQALQEYKIAKNIFEFMKHVQKDQLAIFDRQQMQTTEAKEQIHDLADEMETKSRRTP